MWGQLTAAPALSFGVPGGYPWGTCGVPWGIMIRSEARIAKLDSKTCS